jgi:hypothetical protein
MSLPTNTNVRLTDIIADAQYDRLGNSGSDQLLDLLNRIHQYLGRPFEIVPTSTPSASVEYSTGVQTLPDGTRVAAIKGTVIPGIAAGAINFDLGTISTGGVNSFSVPVMTAGNYIRALIQYSFDNDSLNVSFGTEDPVLANATIPEAIFGYEPICLVELLSTAGGSGAGTFDPINRDDVVYLIDTLDFDPQPIEETQTVAGSPETVFTLTAFTIPSQRNRLTVFVNGIKEIHYTVTSDTEVTFDDPIAVNAEVTFRVE